MQALPDLVLGARGPRCSLAQQMAASPEFQQGRCALSQQCVVGRLEKAICLGVAGCAASAVPACAPALAGAAPPGAGTAPAPLPVECLRGLCDAADALALFGNAALMDPAWKLGDTALGAAAGRRAY